MWKTRPYENENCWLIKLLGIQQFIINRFCWYQFAFASSSNFLQLWWLFFWLKHDWLVSRGPSVENQLRCLVVQYICRNMHHLNRFLAIYTCPQKFVKPIAEEYFSSIHSELFAQSSEINTRKSCEICSKLTMETPGRRQWRHSDGFIVNFEYISHLQLFLLLTLNK